MVKPGYWVLGTTGRTGHDAVKCLPRNCFRYLLYVPHLVQAWASTNRRACRIPGFINVGAQDDYKYGLVNVIVGLWDRTRQWREHYVMNILRRSCRKCANTKVQRKHISKSNKRIVTSTTSGLQYLKMDYVQIYKIIAVATINQPIHQYIMPRNSLAALLLAKQGNKYKNGIITTYFNYRRPKINCTTIFPWEWCARAYSY